MDCKRLMSGRFGGALDMAVSLNQGGTQSRPPKYCNPYFADPLKRTGKPYSPLNTYLTPVSILFALFFSMFFSI